MFERLAEIVQDYNSSGQGKAVLQEYDAYAGKAFILCIVTNLMCRVHEKILQAGELCYMDASASFEPLNSSITLIYTSCAVGALPLGLFITSDELEITLEKSINLLKTILPSYAFFGRGPQVGPIVFITDDSNAERNALELCWPKGIRLLCTFHVMQAFWRWVYNPKHHNIKKEDRAPIMEKMKRILYASSYSEMNTCYYEFKQMFYCLYPLLQKHFELLSVLWNRRQFWALSFCVGLPICGNNTNNYIERSFGMLKDVIFSRTQAYNPVQVFQFIINSMERFYKRRLLGVAHKHSGSLRIAKRFLCPGWETVNSNAIQKTGIENEFLVPSTKNTGFYLVNSVLGTCSCPVGLTGAPCKHQGAVAMKFCIAIFNFIPSLKPDDRMIYSYIALGYVSQDSSFYASLRTEPAPQDQEFSLSSSSFNNNIDKIIEQREPSGKNEEIDISTFTAFLDDVKMDYQNGGKTLRTALDKFKDRYNTAKSKSIPRLSSFLYDINRSMDPMTRVKGGANIRIQVESIKRRKMEGGGVKRRLPIPTNEGKENLDPHAIPTRKKRKTSKKKHNLSKNILKNRPN
ncbi:unnamed protein product [Rhizophagus irregularis]|nr:unnamed protein product [Rhizophagus irregularis]